MKNKFTKLTIYSSIGTILFFIISSLVLNSETLWNIILFPLQSWGGWFLAEIVFNIFFYGAGILLILTPIFGTIASIQTHKNKDQGGLIALLLTGISILFIISQILILI